MFNLHQSHNFSLLGIIGLAKQGGSKIQCVFIYHRVHNHRHRNGGGRLQGLDPPIFVAAVCQCLSNNFETVVRWDDKKD